MISLTLLALSLTAPASAITVASSATLTLPGTVDAVLYSLDEAADGSIYAAGVVFESYTPTLVADLWVGTFDRSLVLIASRTFSVPGAARQGSSRALRVAPDGTVWVNGVLKTISGNAVFLARLDQNLVVLSSMTFDGPSNSEGLNIVFDGGGNGHFVAQSGTGTWLGKLSSSHIFLSSATHDSTTAAYFPHSLAIDSSGNLFTCGTPTSVSTFRLTEFDSALSLAGNTSYNLHADSHGCGDVERGLNGDFYLFGGLTSGITPTRAGIIARVGSNRVFKSSISFVGPNSTNLFPHDGSVDRDGDIWFGGNWDNHIWFGHFSPDLVQRSTVVYDVAGNQARVEAVDAAADGSIIAGGRIDPGKIWIGRVVGPPVRPASISAVAYKTSATWTWSASTSPLVTSYRLSGGFSGLIGATTGYTLTGLVPGTTHFLAVSAVNAAGESAVIGSSAVTTAVAPPSSSTINSATGGSVAYGNAVVDIPPGTFPSSVVVTLGTPSSFPSGSGGLGVGLEITLDQALQPLRDVRLVVPYADASLAGIDESKLILARWDPRGFWVPLKTNVDTSLRTVTALTDHFSLFQVMSAQVAATVDAPRVFPNPFRPSLGHTRVTITNLPAGTRLRIHTIVGFFVRELTTDAAGMATWDGRNATGQDVASGTYLVLAESGGRKLFKVAVQR